MQPQLLKTPTIFNKIERIDDKTFKQICRQCGGKGYYLLQNFNLMTNTIDKKEFVNCEICEGGFIYGDRKVC